MNSRKRKSLDDSLAQAFVYGDDQDSKPSQDCDSQQVKAQSKGKSQTNSIKSNLLAKLKPEAKEPTIRFTADLPESIHRKLSILAARTGKKKVEIVRMLLVEALQGIED